ncbi:recombination protein RecT [Edwardsiella piscicida]
MTNNQQQPPIATADLQKANQVKTQEEAPPEQSLVVFMNQPSMKKQLAAALPRHITAERMIRIITTEIRKNPELAECTQQSFIGSVVQCSQLGLEPGNSLGHAYLIPFNKNKKNPATGKWESSSKEVQLIIGYRGMIDLARRSGQIVSISARTVRQGDQFSYEYGLNETLKHVPSDNDSPPITHVYAVAKMKDGGVQFEVMTFSQIEKVRTGESKTPEKGPWADHWEEMAKKTVIRRLFKCLPVSIEMQKAVILDEKAEANIDQENASVISAEFSVVEE